MKKRLALALVVAMLSSTTLLAAPASAAPAAGVFCGQTITGSVTLTADLVCTGPGPGLTLSPGANLDLGTHTLRGPGVTGGTLLQIGIKLSPSPTRSIIRNGTVTAWPVGIGNENDEQANGAAISDVRFTANTTAVSGYHSDYAITASRFSSNKAAFAATNSTASFAASAFTKNASGIGGAQNSFTVTGSFFQLNGTAISMTESALSVAKSTFTANTTAISTFAAPGAVLTDNNFLANRLAFDSAYNVGDTGSDQLARNRFVGNATAVQTSNDSNLRSNTFIANSAALTASPHDPFGPVLITMVSNYFAFNRQAVYLPVESALSTTTAIMNSGYGIYAPQATDLGGNVAYGNGTQPQCTGVVCTRR